jgi:UDPglucose 6-dehydrogenase
VIYYDPYVVGSSSKEDINKCDIGVICVFTPSGENGECDVSLVDYTVSWLQTPLILIKSTVRIGTTKRLKEQTGKRIVFSPEYIGESTYDTGVFNFNKSVRNHSFFTFGGDRRDTAEFVELFQAISGPCKIYKQTDETSAEIAKYMENCFFATKLVFCYEMFEVCKKAGVDYNEVRECWLLDPRIGPSHTMVLKQNMEPFGGKCLPKDLSALNEWIRSEGLVLKMLQSVEEENKTLGAIRRDRKE